MPREQKGVPKGPYKKRQTTEAMLIAARNRATRSVPAMLEGRRKAEDARRLAQLETSRVVLPTPAAWQAIQTYRTERAKAAERRRQEGSGPVTSGRHPIIRTSVIRVTGSW